MCVGLECFCLYGVLECCVLSLRFVEFSCAVCRGRGREIGTCTWGHTGCQLLELVLNFCIFYLQFLWGKLCVQDTELIYLDQLGCGWVLHPDGSGCGKVTASCEKTEWNIYLGCSITIGSQGIVPITSPFFEVFCPSSFSSETSILLYLKGYWSPLLKLCYRISKHSNHFRT